MSFLPANLQFFFELRAKKMNCFKYFIHQLIIGTSHLVMAYPPPMSHT